MAVHLTWQSHKSGFIEKKMLKYKNSHLKISKVIYGTLSSRQFRSKWCFFNLQWKRNVWQKTLLQIVLITPSSCWITLAAASSSSFRRAGKTGQSYLLSGPGRKTVGVCKRLWPRFTFQQEINPKHAARATVEWEMCLCVRVQSEHKSISEQESVEKLENWYSISNLTELFFKHIFFRFY